MNRNLSLLALTFSIVLFLAGCHRTVVEGDIAGRYLTPDGSGSIGVDVQADGTYNSFFVQNGGGGRWTLGNSKRNGQQMINFEGSDGLSYRISYKGTDLCIFWADKLYSCKLKLK